MNTSVNLPATYTHSIRICYEYVCTYACAFVAMNPNRKFKEFTLSFNRVYNTYDIGRSRFQYRYSLIYVGFNTDIV